MKMELLHRFCKELTEGPFGIGSAASQDNVAVFVNDPVNRRRYDDLLKFWGFIKKQVNIFWKNKCQKIKNFEGFDFQMIWKKPQTIDIFRLRSLFSSFAGRSVFYFFHQKKEPCIKISFFLKKKLLFLGKKWKTERLKKLENRERDPKNVDSLGYFFDESLVWQLLPWENFSRQFFSYSEMTDLTQKNKSRRDIFLDCVCGFPEFNLTILAPREPLTAIFSCLNDRALKKISVRISLESFLKKMLSVRSLQTTFFRKLPDDFREKFFQGSVIQTKKVEVKSSLGDVLKPVRGWKNWKNLFRIWKNNQK